MALDPAKLKYIADFIEKHLGIVYSDTVYYQLEQRLETISEMLNIPGGAEGVYQKAKKDGIQGDFKQFLLDIATNNETSFFRDPKVFAAFEKDILPKLQSEFAMTFNFRMWSAAASFGQEPYSLAMIVDEFLEKNPKSPRIEIVATDIADHALARCREARYTQLEVQRGLPATRLVKHFEKATEAGFWNLKSNVKNRVSFRKQNLLEPFSQLGMFHVIFCRYVLIYQTPERKKEIVLQMEKCLAPRGYLIFGASESAFGLSQNLEQIADNGVIIYRKKAEK